MHHQTKAPHRDRITNVHELSLDQLNVAGYCGSEMEAQARVYEHAADALEVRSMAKSDIIRIHIHRAAAELDKQAEIAAGLGIDAAGISCQALDSSKKEADILDYETLVAEEQCHSDLKKLPQSRRRIFIYSRWLCIWGVVDSPSINK